MLAINIPISLNCRMRSEMVSTASLHDLEECIDDRKKKKKKDFFLVLVSLHWSSEDFVYDLNPRYLHPHAPRTIDSGVYLRVESLLSFEDRTSWS